MANLKVVKARRERPRHRLVASAASLALLLLVLALNRSQRKEAAAVQAAPQVPAALTTAALLAPGEDSQQQGAAAAAAAGQTPGGEQRPTAAAAAAAQPSSSTGTTSGSEDVRTGIFFDLPAEPGQQPAQQELLNEPVPEDCHMEAHADYDGPALTWGLTFKTASAAQCCQACKDRRQPEADGTRCNAWVWCGSPRGECWSPDIWNHTTGECWLKWQKDWDGKVDLAVTNLAVNSRGRYPPEYRREHRTSPEMVEWTAGVIPARLL